MTKYIFVTGGVVSSIGKGITSASLGRLLRNHGWVVAPMKLAATAEGKPILAAEADQAAQGRKVFLRNCAVCHSSKQPEDFGVTFSDEWQSARPGGRLPDTTDQANGAVPPSTLSTLAE